MPCKIQIRKNINGKIEARTDAGFNKSLPVANYMADRVNEDFKYDVVKFSKNSNGEIIRDINIPDELVDKYYDNELRIEEKEVAKIQIEDAKRAGVEYTDDYLFQKEGTEGSVASPGTIKVLKDFLNRIGVDIATVKEISKNGVKQNANGAAILTQQLVQIVEGKEDVALGEESMHWAVEIIQQKDPKLFNKMLKEVNDYAIYKQVLNDYSSDPAYQTASRPRIT